MNTDLLKQLALRSAGGAAGGAALGGYVAPEGSRLDGAGLGALAGGLAGAGSLALHGGGAGAAPRDLLGPAPHLPVTAAPMPSTDAMRAAHGLSPRPAPGTPEHLGQYVEDMLLHKRAGYAAAYAAMGLEKEAWAPLVAAGARALPTLARAGRSLMGGNLGGAAKGVQAAARGAGRTFAQQAPKTTAALQAAGRVASNPLVQTGAMMAAM